MEDYDLTILTGSTGPALVMLRHWRANLALNVDRIWLGGNELAWYSSLNPAVTWQFTDGELTWDATVTDRRYDETSMPDVKVPIMGTGLALGNYFQQRKVATQVGVRLVGFNAEDDFLGYDGYELLAGLIIKAWPNGTLYARANYRTQNTMPLTPVSPRRATNPKPALQVVSSMTSHRDIWKNGRCTAAFCTPVTDPTSRSTTTTGARLRSIWAGHSDRANIMTLGQSPDSAIVSGMTA